MLEEKTTHCFFTPFISAGMNFIGGPGLAHGYGSDKADSLLGHFDSLSMKPFSIGKPGDRELDSPNSIAQGLTSNLLGSSSPVNIPSRPRMELGTFASPSSPSLRLISGAPFHSPVDEGNSLFGDALNKNKIGSYPSGSGNMYSFSPPANPAITRPTSAAQNSIGSVHSNTPIGDPSDLIKKPHDVLSPNRAAIVSWEERIAQARIACEAWKQEAEDSKIKATIAAQQRDEALRQLTTLNMELEKMKNDPYLVALNRQSDLKSFPMHVLQSLHARLKRDLDEINRVIAEKCTDLNKK